MSDHADLGRVECWIEVDWHQRVSFVVFKLVPDHDAFARDTGASVLHGHINFSVINIDTSFLQKRDNRRSQ
jgi:hypothetical protein